LTLPAGYACILLISIVFPANRVSAVALGMLAWTSAHLALAAWLIRYRLPGSFRFSRDTLRPLARFGGLSVGATAPGWLNARLDQLVIGAFLPPRLLGLYAVGVSWSMAVTPLANAFSQVILPRLAGAVTTDEAVTQLGTTSRLAAVTTAATGVLFLLASPAAVFILFGGSFVPAIPATLVLVIGAVLLGMTQFLEEAVRGLGDPGIAARAEVVGLVVTVPALFLLLPRLSILGAALASVLSYAAILGALSLLLRTRYGLRPAQLFVPRPAELGAVAVYLRSALGGGSGSW
jgi:O-antigen/teichoic acid export membrane protein